MRIALLALIVAMLSSCSTKAQWTTRIIRDSLFIPWELIYGPDDHIWFTQKNGYICRMEPISGHIDTLYHELNTVVNNEGGMLGMALHPSFSSQPFVFVAYEYLQGSSYLERIVKYTYSNNSLSSPLVLLDGIAGGSIHNGCRLLIIGDKLFITTGEVGNGALHSQNINSKNGKTLRINLDGSIPADNPFPGNPAWSWGHRNAQGLVYANSKMYSSEHGPNSDDEFNIILKGRNYGWPNVSGFCNTTAEITFCNDSNVIEPLKAWTPTIAVSGIDYYNHPMFPQFQNNILMTTLKDQHLIQLVLNGAGDSVISSNVVAGVSFGRLRDICISPSGRIYISTSNSSASGTGSKVDKIIEIYDPSFVAVNDPVKSKITVYPNPAADYAIIRVPIHLFMSSMEYTMLNMEGKMILKGPVNSDSTQVNMNRLAKGVYKLIISLGKSIIYTEKIMKQ
jgi:aldose sugar dehydrogenase